MSKTSVVMLAVMAIATALFTNTVYTETHTLESPRGEDHQLHSLQVLALGLDKFHYEFRDERGTDFWAHFCHDYEPQFSPGMTLTVMTYRDMGDCWSVKDTHPAYLIKRDKHGKIIKEEFHVRREEAETAAR